MPDSPRRLVPAAAFIVLLLNSAYLAAYATPSLFYFANVILHIALGIALAVAGVGYVLTLRGMHVSIAAALFAAGLLLGAAAVTGLYLTIVGASGHTRLLQAHIVSATLGSLALIVWLIQVASRSTDRVARRAAMATTIVLLAATSVAFVQAQRYERDR